MYKYILSGFVTLALGVVLGWALFGGSVDLGGTTNFDSLSLSENLTVAGTAAFNGTIRSSRSAYQGGVNSTSTTATTYTLVSGDIVGYSTISMTPNTGSLNLVLPSSSTMSTWLPNSGDRTSIILFNATTSAGIQIGLVPGTGSLLEIASSSIGTTALTASTTPAKAMRLEVFRKWNTDLVFLAQPFF